jgi:hypothetical protein
MLIIQDRKQLRWITLCVNNLELGTTAEQLADWFYETIGLDVPAHEISCKDVGRYSANAFMRIDSNVLSAFLNRYLEGAHICGRQVQVEPKLFKQG